MASPLPTPRRLLGGRYLLGEPIGSGGMGVVYTATQAALRRRVAVKILHAELVTNPAILERFRREALAASRVSHPNLVTILDVGELPDGTPFLVMDFVPGRPLGELLRTHLLPLDQVVRIVRQVLAALAEAHRCGVVHADVKSDNVLVDDASSGAEKVKLIDFGLACIGPCESPSSAGGERTVAGTPEFMAPEVILGSMPGPAADLYGVGVVLYELLTGGTPFAGGSAGEIMNRHLAEPVMPPSLRRPDRGISRAVDDVVLRALAKEPADRFRSADDLSGALLAAASAAVAPCWCHDCGGPLACDAERCAMCGAVVPAAPDGHPFGTDLDTEVLRLPPSPPPPRPEPRRRARPSTSAQIVEEERRLRAAIGQAIRDGAVGELTDGYLALARQLAGRGHLIAAMDELSEGLDVVTAGCAMPSCTQAAHRLRTALLQLHATLAIRDGDEPSTSLAR